MDMLFGFVYVVIFLNGLMRILESGSEIACNLKYKFVKWRAR